MGLNRNASEKDIKSAYRKLSKIYHPDISEKPDAKEMFPKITEAYDVLKNPKLREIYDRHGLEGVK